jgi:hypothetical protein
MPTLISGVRGTANIEAAKRIVDMSKSIAELEPDAAPLTVFLKKMGGKGKVAINPEFKWLENELMTRWDQCNYGTNYTAGATSIVVDNGAYFRIGDVVKVAATKEQMLVTNVATNTLTVTRGWGSTSAGNILDDGYLLILGNANEEGATKPALRTVKEAVKTNYTQIFRTPFGVTETTDKSDMYGGSDINVVRKNRGVDHMKSIEEAFLFGEPKEDTGGTHPRRATGGLNYFISTNRTDASGTLAESEMETFCRSIFRYGSNKKLLLASPLVISAINSWASGKLNMVPKDSTYGVNIKEYLSGHGTLYIAKHNLLEQSYAGYAVAVDMDNVDYRYIQGRDTKLLTDRQDPSEDSKIEEYLTEAGLECKLEKTHGILYGVTSY